VSCQALSSDIYASTIIMVAIIKNYASIAKDSVSERRSIWKDIIGSVLNIKLIVKT
jgi:hypothetical protein